MDIAVLGGIRLDGLDRMRATLKVGLKDSNEVPPPVRHNLDLYNDLAVEKLIRRIAERLEVGTSLIAAALSDLPLFEVFRRALRSVNNGVSLTRKLEIVPPPLF